MVICCLLRDNLVRMQMKHSLQPLVEFIFLYILSNFFHINAVNKEVRQHLPPFHQVSHLEDVHSCNVGGVDDWSIANMMNISTRRPQLMPPITKADAVGLACFCRALIIPYFDNLFSFSIT